MPNDFTTRARKVVALAKQESERFGLDYIGTEHILLGLVKGGNGVGAQALKNLGVDIRNVRIEVERLFREQAHDDRPTPPNDNAPRPT